MSEATVKGQRVRLKKDYVKLIRKAVERACQQTKMRVFGYTIGANSPVPIEYGTLRMSVEITEKQSPKGFATGLIIKWTTDYADILVRKGLAGTAQARVPGTTLLYPQAVKPVLTQVFVEELRNALVEEDLT
jgi:hypothetical protein